MRAHFKLFTEGSIAGLTLPNRLVRSATWDPAILQHRKMRKEVLHLYREVAAGGVGLIITGDFSVVPRGMFEAGAESFDRYSYADVRIEGFSELVKVVRSQSPTSKIIAQVSGEAGAVGPSEFTSPFSPKPIRPLTATEVEALIERFADSIEGVMRDGFDGVQLHAAHGGLLSLFLSPYTNRRRDEYGGSPSNRASVISRIVARARDRVGSFPLLIKMNCTDYLEGGIDADDFRALAHHLARSGIDAIEVSGGMRECLLRTERDLGFRPVPSPESHTRIRHPEKQSYFLEFVRGTGLPVPLILCGGNRNVERVERVLKEGEVDFISMCRPLLCEPDLPRRWLEGRGPSEAACVSCNSCIYHMRTQLQRGAPKVATCLFRKDRTRVKAAQRWLSSWVEEQSNRRPSFISSPRSTTCCRERERP